MGNTENANKRPKQVFSKSAFPLSEEVFRKRKDQDVGRTQTQILTGTVRGMNRARTVF